MTPPPGCLISNNTTSPSPTWAMPVSLTAGSAAVRAERELGAPTAGWAVAATTKGNAEELFRVAATVRSRAGSCTFRVDASHLP